MIRPLRRFHRLVFTLLALGLPILLAVVLAARHRWPLTTSWPPLPAVPAAAAPAAAPAASVAGEVGR